MALVLTARGHAETTGSISATNTVTSTSFTPTAGGMVAVRAAGFLNDSNAHFTFTLSDTFGDSGGGSWAEQKTIEIDSGTFSERASIWTRIIGTAPSAGTITVTRTAGSTDQWFSSTFCDITGQAASPIGVTGSNNGSNVTTLTVTLSGSPAADSIVLGVIGTDQNLGTDITPPSGWTEANDVSDGFVVARIETASINGSASSTPQWSTLPSGTGVCWAVAVEIKAAASTGLDVPLLAPIPSFNVHRM